MKHCWVMFMLLCFFLAACSGSGSSSGSTGKGTVALYVADGPTDDYENIWVWVKGISLMPSNGDEPVSVFQSEDDDGYQIDLLDLRDQDMLLTVNEQIPAGEYGKIRLIIAGIIPEGGTGECSDFEVKLPSGKIDLVPDGPVVVTSGETVSIRLDMDAEKSINLHTAGSSEKCIFRPVVFVDIGTEAILPADCPVIQSGTIETLVYETDGENIEGFVLALDGGRGDIGIALTDATFLFDANGNRVTTLAFDVGQSVFVRGGMNEEGLFETSLIVLGGVESFKGTSGDSGETGFTLDLDSDSGSLAVSLTDDTLNYRGCDQRFEGSMIPAGASVRAFGKFVSEETDNEFRAVLVLFESRVSQATLTAVEKTTGGYTLTVTDSDNPVYFLPEDAIARVEGDGSVDMTELTTLVACQSRDVILKMEDETAETPVLSELVVMAESLSATVTSTDPDNLTLSTAGGLISVKPTATLLKLNDGFQAPIEFDAIQTGDELTLYGLAACDDDENDIVFYAYILMVMP